MHKPVLAVGRSLTVCPSVTLVYCIVSRRRYRQTYSLPGISVNVEQDNAKCIICTACNRLRVSLAPATQQRINVMDAGRSGLAVTCLTAVREVLGSNRAACSYVYRKTTAIYSLVHGLCGPFLQCLGQLSLLPYVGW